MIVASILACALAPAHQTDLFGLGVVRQYICRKRRCRWHSKPGVMGLGCVRVTRSLDAVDQDDGSRLAPVVAGRPRTYGAVGWNDRGR